MNLTNVTAPRALILALSSVLAAAFITGCASDAPAFAVAGPFGGGTISQNVIDNEPRPPKQVVYRFDDHRYIESDPTGGFVGGCQGELFYVDEKLGIRTEFGGNKVGNPRGLFHVESPYVVVRDAFGMYVSPDHGKTFFFEPIDKGDDLLVIGEDIYVGGGGASPWAPAAFSRNYVDWYVINMAEKKIEHRHKTGEGSDRKLEATILLKMREKRTSLSTEADYFSCKDLPWRPSAGRERELLRQQRSQP